MSTHRIHLRGPWDYSFHPATTDQTHSDLRTGFVSMPREWGAIFGETSGTALFLRKFHRPTNLSNDERVVILCTEVRGFGKASLNSQPLGDFDADGTSVEFDVTGLLKSFNEFRIETTFDPALHPGQPGGPFGVVALEIRSE